MRKIGLICLALVLALGALGVGFAMWDKTLYIDGTVNTGEVDAIFTTASSNDPGTTIDPGNLITGEPKDKHVGSTEVTGNGTQRLTIVVDNGYPCYESTVNFTIDNIGTIPVKVQRLSLSSVPSQITVNWTGPAVGTQIDAGCSVPGDIHIHVEQSAAELATYNFTAEIYLVQWNEYED